MILWRIATETRLFKADDLAGAGAATTALQLSHLLKAGRKRRKLTQADVTGRLGLSHNRVSYLGVSARVPSRPARRRGEMGRRSHSQTLGLWANGDYVGLWTITAGGGMELQYDAGWLASPRGRPISLSLPYNLNNEPLKGGRVAHYFEGLLPDSDAIRKRVAAH